jgi:hypothetical protein
MVQASGFWYFKNFWDVQVALGYLPDQHDYFLLGAPFTHFARRPKYGIASLSGSTDSRKKLFVFWDYSLAHFFNADNKAYHVVDMGFRYRFNNRFSMELSNRHESETDYIVYAGAETTGEPIIGFVDFKDVTSILSGSYNFAPRINLTFRARHYWSHVPYNRFANVDAKGNAIARDPSLPAPDVNSNVNIFNLDAFFTWDFRLGSRVIVGYKNWLGEEYTFNQVLATRYLNNLEKTFDTGHGNEWTVKLIYFLDYNQLRKRK